MHQAFPSSKLSSVLWLFFFFLLLLSSPDLALQIKSDWKYFEVAREEKHFS